MHVKIKSIFVNDKKQNGEPYVDKNGRPFKRAVLETEDGKKASKILPEKYGAKDLAIIEEWKKGDTVDVIFEENGEYMNFKIPNKTDQVAEKTEGLEGRVDILEREMRFLKSIYQGKQTQKETSEIQSQIKSEVPEYGEIRVEDIPF